MHNKFNRWLPNNSDQFRQQALHAEAEGRWTDTWLNFAAKRRLFHLAVPKCYGGHQLPLPDLLQIMKQASLLDGSFGWTLTLGIGAGIFAAFMNPLLLMIIF